MTTKRVKLQSNKIHKTNPFSNLNKANLVKNKVNKINLKKNNLKIKTMNPRTIKMNHLLNLNKSINLIMIKILKTNKIIENHLKKNI